VIPRDGHLDAEAVFFKRYVMKNKNGAAHAPPNGNQYQVDKNNSSAMITGTMTAGHHHVN